MTRRMLTVQEVAELIGAKKRPDGSRSQDKARKVMERIGTVPGLGAKMVRVWDDDFAAYFADPENYDRNDAA